MLHQHLRRFVVVGTAALLAACNNAMPAMPTETVADVRAVIDAKNATFMRWVAAGAADSVGTAYHTDGVAMLSHAPVATGREGIVAFFGGLFASDVRLNLETLDLSLADSIAVEHGRYTLALRDKADTTRVLGTDAGSYVVEWRKRDGVWLMHWDIAATDVPMPAPAE